MNTNDFEVDIYSFLDKNKKRKPSLKSDKNGNKFTFLLKERGNYYELHRVIHTKSGNISQPIITFSTKKSALQAGKEWKTWHLANDF